MSNRSQRNAYYSSLDFPYQRYQTPYFGDDGAPSIAENSAKRNALYDSMPYPYQRDQTKEYSNISGPPKGIEEKRDVRNAYYNSLADPYMRYQPYVVQPNMPFPYYGQQQPEQVVLPNGDMGFVDNNGNVIDEGAPVAQPPVIVPANLQSFSLLQQQQESGGETLAQEQQDFYSNAAGKKTGKGKGCATRPGDADCAEGQYSNAAGKKTGKGCATRPGDEDCQNAEGPMDFAKSHAMVIGGVVLTGVVAVGVYLKFFKKGGK